MSSNRSSLLRFLLGAGVLAAALLIPAVLPAQNEVPGDEDLARQQAVMERYFTVLEKNPRKSTALDKLYGFHVENGSLDKLVGRYQEKVKTNEKDGVAWTILGLIEAERGRDAAAVEAFTKAVANTQTSLPAFYLGQSLVLVGQTDKAIEAFELAITRKPLAADQLDVYRALGRVHQRAQRSKEALAVWERLEKLYPNDGRVQEQIAATLVEEGQFALALPRYETLVKLTKDDYRKAVYRIEAAELKVKLNRSKEAIADLETMLAALNPTSWLHRDVRRRIDDVFLRTDDQDGLAKYYEAWVQKNPEDIDAMARLARILARQARVPEAQVWLDKALKLAPSRKELRLAFIEQLVESQRFPEAIQQYETLDKLDPNNPDYLRDWGKLTLRDTSRTKDERLVAAEKIWRRLLIARPKDPLIATQVADLFRHNELSEPALELYQKAVELAPDQPQYREYLGEYYHQLKRPAEAEATWRQIAEGKNRNATNLSRLAEVFASFGYLPQALPPMQAACTLEPKDFSLHVKAAQLYVKAEKYPDALAALTIAEKLAQNDEESEGVLTEQLKIYQLDDSLAKRLAALVDDVKKNPSVQQFYLLARYYETLRQYPEGTAAIKEALKLEPRSLRSLATAARIDEQAGELKAAADLNRQLAVIDRRNRGEYWKHVAQLEMQLGRTEEALQAGKELIASAPGNSENYEFYAQLCFRLAQQEEGLQALRRAMRVNPTEPKLLLALASALAEQFRTDEALEMYWQAFDKGKEIDERINIVQKLTELYLQANQFDRLLERLDRTRRDAQDKREATICLAQAYHSAGDFGMARQELEGLLSENTRDTQLLQQLSKLAEAERDFAGAVKYQEQLAKLAPGPEAEYRLATLLAASGAAQESAAIIVRLTQKEEDPEKLLRSIDSLLQTEQKSTALLIVESKLREDPKNWELLYREGYSLSNKPEEAKRRFEAILALNLDSDTPGIAERNRRIKAAKSKTPAAASQRATQMFYPLQMAYSVRSAVGLGDYDYYSYSGSRQAWVPNRYGDARMAALGWLYRFAKEANAGEAFIKGYQTAAEAPMATDRQEWDWLYVNALTNDRQQQSEDTEMLDVARRLAQRGDPEGQALFLTTIISRAQVRAQRETKEKPKPLAADDVALLVTCYEGVRKRTALDGNIDSTSTYFTRAVANELKLAGRTEESEQLVKQIVANAKTPSQLMSVMALRAEDEQHDEFLGYFDKWSSLTLQDSRNPQTIQSVVQVAQLLSRRIGELGAEKKHDDVLLLLDRYLTHHDAWASVTRQQTQRKQSRSAANLGSHYYSVWYGKRQQHVAGGNPLPSIYFDQGALQVLRNTFEVFKRNDVLSDLEKHLQKRRESAKDADLVNYQFAFVAFHTWNAEPEKALAEIAAASERVPQDMNLRMQAVRGRVAEQQFDEALALLDAIAPLDQDTLRERETLALEVAVRLGAHDRARQAAERLFGLRLDPEVQVQLASQMRRLGMNAEADAVLARAQRQGGNRLAALVALMSAHQADGKHDTAAQIAYQILRQSRKPANQSTLNMRLRGGGTVEDSYRNSALHVLGAAGKLKQMIAEVEQQLVRAPESNQLFDTLAEYYEAAGDQQKGFDLQLKLVNMRPEDYALRMQFAMRLTQRGKHSEACDQLKIVFAKQPQLMRNNTYELADIFRRAKRTPELLQVIQTIDMKQFGQAYYAINMISQLIRENNKEDMPAAVALIKKVWEAFPEQRGTMLSSIYNEDLWANAEMYDIAKQTLLPGKNSKTSSWTGMATITSYGSNGEVNSVLKHVLKAAKTAQRLPQLRSDLAAAAKERPDWKAGAVLIALIDAQQGKFDDARAAIKSLLGEDKENSDMPAAAMWIIGLEIEQHEKLRDLAIKLYERAMTDANLPQVNGGDFQYTPGPRLLKMYLAAGNKEEAVKLLKRAEAFTDDDNDPGYSAYRKAQHYMQLATTYQENGYSIDALRTYRRLLTTDMLSNSNLTSFGNADYYRQQSQEGLQRLLEQLAASNDPTVVQELLQPNPKAGDAPALDLMLSLQQDEAGKPRLESHLIALLTKRKLSPELQTSLQSRLTELRQQHPADLSVLAVSALVALHWEKDDVAAQRVVEFQQALDKQPLETLQPAERPNARQREQAQRQLSAWPIALECLKRKNLQPNSEALTARAIEAARRQVDRNYVTAILWARSDHAATENDRNRAEQYLGELLTHVLTRPQARAGKMQLTPVTHSQFKMAAATAHTALERNMPKIALQAIQESLRGGMPVSDQIAMSPSGVQPRRITVSGNGEVATDQIVASVTDELTRLSITWRRKQFPAAEMYGALHDVVLPTDRPGMIIVAPRHLASWSEPDSLGLELVRWALATGQAETLRTEFMARNATAKDEVNAMRMFLAIEQKDHPAALAVLQELQAPAAARTTSTGVLLSAHSAALAFKDRDLQDQAAPVLTSFFKQSERSPLPLQGLLPLLSRYYLKQKKIAEVQTIYTSYLQSRQASYSNYGGDYGMYIQRSDMAGLVNTMAQAGDVKLTLEYLGKLVDLPVPDSNYGETPLELSVWHLAWQLRLVPAAERYALLKDWTLPTENRRKLRLVVGVNPGLQTPAVFLPPEFAAAGELPIGMISNFSLLVEAARETGKLAELQTAVTTLAGEKIPNADALSTLIAIAMDDPQVPARLKEIETAVRARIKAAPKTGTRPDPVEDLRSTETLILTAALASPRLRPDAMSLGHLILQDNRKGARALRAAQLYRLLAEGSIAHASAVERTQLQTPGLKHWTPGSPVAMTVGAFPPAWWAASGNQVSHITGFEADALFFNYPLTGTFEFSFEAHSYDYSAGEMGYGGLDVLPQFWTKSVSIRPTPIAGETVSRGILADGRKWWNRYRVQVTPAVIRFYCNDHLVYEEKEPSATSPWLHLASFNQRRTNFRNLKLTGAPQIPRELTLVTANRLDGWGTTMGSSIMTRIKQPEAMPETGAYATGGYVSSRARPAEPVSYDWYAEDGVLHGAFRAGLSESRQSHIFYHRSLLSGETLRYEFFYEPGKTHVHPTTGRLAYLLEPTGVRLHWLQGGPTITDPVELDPLNSLAADANPQPLPLRANDWNAVEFKLVGNEVNLSLNGQPILKRVCEPTVSQRFGFFHYSAQTAAKVRNITLRGNWPAELKPAELVNLLEPFDAAESVALRQMRHALVREEELADEAYDVWLTAQQLAPEERFAQLRDWVLPHASHRTFRLLVNYTPVDQPLPTLSKSLKLSGTRQHTGGELISPALELVRTAAELKRLPELAELVRAADAEAPEAARNRLALLTAIALAHGDEATAATQLKLLQEEHKTLSPAVPVHQRHAEIVAILAALDRPATRPAALALAKQVVENQQEANKGVYQTFEWERLVRYVRARAAWLNDPTTASLPMGAPPAKPSQWTPVSHPTADNRGHGVPPAAWSLQKGKAEFFTGHGADSIYFQSPLAGDFELRLRRTTHGWKEIYPLYGNIGIDIYHDGASVWRNVSQLTRTQTKLPAKLATFGPQIDFRLVVKDGDYTAFFNNEQVHTERLKPNSDPWLVIQSYAPQYAGNVENVQILGSPRIPESIDLSAFEDLRAWRYNYYGDNATPEPTWRKVKDEIVGDLLPNAAGSDVQSVIRYHRPMLEDGVIEYDFFYEAGKTEIHPALDRAAILLSPTGVKLHYLTDGPFDRTGLAPGNVTDLPGASDKVPLKDKAWNHARVELVGDVMSVTINDQPVAKYTLEPTNQRHFSLFRFSDRTAARIKNVHYSGNWPKMLPPLAQQELSKAE